MPLGYCAQFNIIKKYVHLSPCIIHMLIYCSILYDDMTKHSKILFERFPVNKCQLRNVKLQYRTTRLYMPDGSGTVSGVACMPL